jgi:competence protein ComEC
MGLIVAGGLWLLLWRSRWRLMGLPVILFGLASASMVDRPDILVSHDGRLLAVRGVDGALTVSTDRRARFSRERWLQQEGQTAASIWPQVGASADGRMRCDPLGCVYRWGDAVVAVIRDVRALQEDCRAATLVIATVPVDSPCPSARTVIDIKTLARDGAHAIWLRRGRPDIMSDRSWRGSRPWVIRAEPRAGR